MRQRLELNDDGVFVVCLLKHRPPGEIKEIKTNNAFDHVLIVFKFPFLSVTNSPKAIGSY